ncbi:MAG: hypothetical protein RSB90_10875, partial [Eubacterium sp.]
MNTYWEERIANSIWQLYNDLEKKNRDVLLMYRKAAAGISNEIYEIEKTLCQDGFLDGTLLNRYGRLKKIHQSFRKIIKNLGDEIEKACMTSLTKRMRQNYKNISDQLGIDLNLPNLGVFEEMVKQPWRGDDFSKRIWKNMDKLLLNLKNIMV